jgi:hypothetical protein
MVEAEGCPTCRRPGHGITITIGITVTVGSHCYTKIVLVMKVAYLHRKNMTDRHGMFCAQPSVKNAEQQGKWVV